MSPYQPPDYASLDEAYIAQCLQIAELGDGFVSPNPMVGAIVLDAEGRVIGRGHHPKLGEAHAEVFALKEAGERAKGGILYVSLEPCNHQGRTSACTHAIIEAGISRVVFGTLDPNPKVAGSGRDYLQSQNISVCHGFLEAECERLNESFFHHIRHQAPFITIKLALSMDGKIANRHGESQWLTGPLSRQVVHQMRQRVDAVVTTAETVLADNPSLTVRDAPFIRRQPGKIIFDRRMRLNPEQHKIFHKEGKTPILWLVAEQYTEQAKGRLSKTSSIRVLGIPELDGHLDLQAAFQALYHKDFANLLVESGGQFASALLDQHLAQKLYLFYAPKLLRDSMAKPAFSQAFQLGFPQAPQLQITQSQLIDQDWLVEARPYESRRLIR
jgi:diaminohydroxyphosphoribosylaminopyrimidine deaminase/5-amino-6-(5-phosphoribosylamino)uracil reductase